MFWNLTPNLRNLSKSEIIFCLYSLRISFWLFISRNAKNKKRNTKSNKIILAKMRNSNKTYNKSKGIKAKFWFYNQNKTQNNNNYNPSINRIIIAIKHLLSFYSLINYTCLIKTKA